MNKNINNRAVLGGCLGFIAFFLPWIAVAFIVGSNLATLAGNGAKVFYLELLAALALIVFGVLVPRLGRIANVLIVFAALLGIAFLLHIFFQEFFTALALDKGSQQWGGFLLLGLGFWLAAIGYIVALLGGLKGLREQ